MARNTRKHKKRMVGGTYFRAFMYEFKVGFELLGYNANADTNVFIPVEDNEVIRNADKLVDLLTKRIVKGIELGHIHHIRNIEVVYIEDTYFQLICEIDIDKVKDRIRFIEDMVLDVTKSDELDNQIEDLPLLNENEVYSNQLMRSIIFSNIEEYELETVELGRNLSALKTGFTKGTKADPELGRGLANMSSNILGRIGSFLSGKEETLHKQRSQLRKNIGYMNEIAPAGGAGAGANKGGGRSKKRKTLHRRRS